MTKQYYFIIEGENATGKTTLVNSLSKQFQAFTVVYPISKEFEKLRSNAYDKWSNETSLFYYIAANFEVFNNLSNNCIIFDRSLISTFSIYLSRLPEDEWESIIPIFTFCLKFMPNISDVFLLTASETVRQERIKKKSKKEMNADLKEIYWEEQKNRARQYLLKISNWNTTVIDTSHLSPEDVLNQVSKDIEGKIFD